MQAVSAGQSRHRQGPGVPQALAAGARLGPARHRLEPRPRVGATCANCPGGAFRPGQCRSATASRPRLRRGT
eukprot:7348165-Alexandrium_andersonii.AAC.1